MFELGRRYMKHRRPGMPTITGLVLLCFLLLTFYFALHNYDWRGVGVSQLVEPMANERPTPVLGRFLAKQEESLFLNDSWNVGAENEKFKEMNNWILLHQGRLSRIRDHCSSTSSFPARGIILSKAVNMCLDDYFGNILIDRRFKLAYCDIPKVASSSTKLALVKMAHPLNLSLPRSVHCYKTLKELGFVNLVDFAKHCEIDEIQQSWNSMTRFLIVRHPFERLLSAYVDKFTHLNKWTDYFHTRYGKLIVDLYRESPPAGAHHNVSFPEFVRFLLDDEVPCQRKLNPHWSPYGLLCRPCQLEYTRIIRYENLAEELNLLWNDIYHEPITEEIFGVLNASPHRTRSKLVVYMDALPATDVERLYDMYRDDFDMFGYSWPLT